MDVVAFTVSATELRQRQRRGCGRCHRVRVQMVAETRPAMMPVKLSEPKNITLTELPPIEVEGERFRRQGKKIAKDGSYVEVAYELKGKGGLRWLNTAVQRTFDHAVRGNQREFLKYEPEVMKRYYDSQPLVVANRISRILVPFSGWFIQYVTARAFFSNKDGELSDETTLRLASELRKALVKMGPTFVKIGQALSQRPDIAGPVFCDELKKLQDSVATFPTETAFKIMTDEYNRPIDAIFDYMSPEPVAAASLGQVYKGHLIGAPDNEFVAVKVQRPGIGTDASIDLYLTRKLAVVIKKALKLRTNLVAVNDEFGLRLFEETNYVQEARNCQRFRALYNDIEGIFIPDVYPEWTTRYVLCQEWVEGTKAPWGQDALRLIDVGIQCTLRQLLDAGFFHADPHPGNLLRTADGRLAYLDFGMMSEVEPQKRYDLIGSVMHLINQDYVLLTDDLVKLDFLPEDVDRQAISPVLEEAFSKASGADGSISDLSFSKLATYMAGVAFKTPIRLPPYYSLVIRSLTILEGIALSENQKFKIVDEAFPYVSKRLLLDSDPELRKRLREVLVDPKTGRLRWNRLENIIRQGEKGTVGSTGVGVLSKGVSDSDTVEKMVEYLLSPEGEFLRDALVEDLVDTADSAQLAFQVRLSEATGGLIPKPLDQPNLALLQNVSVVGSALQNELLNRRRRVRSEGIRSSANAGVNGARGLLENAPAIQEQATKAMRVIVGGLLEKNTSRAYRTALSFVENAINSRINAASGKARDNRSR